MMASAQPRSHGWLASRAALVLVAARCRCGGQSQPPDLSPRPTICTNASVTGAVTVTATNCTAGPLVAYGIGESSLPVQGTVVKGTLRGNLGYSRPPAAVVLEIDKSTWV